ncbi:unnamed protein product [Allacma fusca]|uniref:ER-bound oxygenase mpaB/mpaB'/Rubber oxygenase catalytic domain-containing protein n=1 Tax=Allacma fusca TaxID=39272 RepID=A0A8J2P5H6_9HEXA|nr:unnamed protein product [Allacma fusca]
MLKLAFWGCFFIGTFTLNVSAETGPEICASCNENLLCVPLSDSPSFTKSPAPVCSVPLDNLTEGIGIHGVSERVPPFTPPWLNTTLYHLGQKFARDNIAIISYCHYLGAVIAFSSREAGYILANTGNSDKRINAIKNNLSHIRHLWLWYENDLLNPNNIAAQSITRIRSIHEEASKQIGARLQNDLGLVDKGIYDNRTVNERLWKAIDMDLRASRIPQKYREPPIPLLTYTGEVAPFPQFAMTIAQYLFVGLTVIMPEIQEVLKASEEELLGWNHLWAVIGHALGMEEPFNIALQPDLDSIKHNYQEMFNTYILPNFFNLEKESKVLMEMLLSVSGETLPSGIYSFSPTILMNLILTELMGIAAPRTMGLLTFEEQQRLGSWTRLKKALRRSKQPLMSTLNADIKRGLDEKGRFYYGQVYTSQDSISKYMFL